MRHQLSAVRIRAAAGMQYAMLLGLVGVVVLVAVSRTGDSVSTLFGTVSNRLGNAGAGGATTSGGGGGGSGSAAPQPPAGTLMAWGGSSTMGNGSTGIVAYPTNVTIAGGTGFTAVESAQSSTCAIQAGSGVLWCWGTPSNGQLGDNQSGTTRLVPVRVRDASNNLNATAFTTVSGGANAYCAIDSAQLVWCWGWALRGMLGDNQTTTDRLTPVRITDSGGTPLATTFTDVSVGGSHSCAVQAGNGYGWCWGIQNAGRLGDNQDTGATIAVPQRMRDAANNPSTLSWSQITTGTYSGCGIQSSTGFAYCWGAGNNGMQGSGATSAQLVATRVKQSAGVDFSGTWLQLEAGSRFVCGIRADTGNLWCWGQNDEGQLAINTAGADQLLPVRALDAGGAPLNVTFTILAITDQGSGSGGGGCAIESGTAFAWCWGRGGTGQIGDKATTQRNSPVRVTDASGSPNLTRWQFIGKSYSSSHGIAVGP